MPRKRRSPYSATSLYIRQVRCTALFLSHSAGILSTIAPVWGGGRADLWIGSSGVAMTTGNAERAPKTLGEREKVVPKNFGIITVKRSVYGMGPCGLLDCYISLTNGRC